MRSPSGWSGEALVPPDDATASDPWIADRAAGETIGRTDETPGDPTALAALPARPARWRGRATPCPAALSQRELEVLRGVADGLTNAQVADRLFLSPRTIHAHLYRIYGKLGVSSRSAATRYVVQRGLA